MKYNKMNRVFITGILAVLMMILMVGCSGRNQSTRGTDMAEVMPSQGEYAEAPAEYPAAEYGDKAEEAIVDEEGPFEQNRKIIRNKYMQVETLEFDMLIEKLEQLVKEYMGYIDSSEVAGRGIYQKNVYNTRTANYILRIPANDFDAFAEELRTSATILIERENKKDVTTQYFDIEARIRTLKVQEERLLELLEAGASLEEILAIENQLSDVRYEIETNTATLKNLEQQVQYSTLQVEVREVYEISEIEEPAITIGEKISKGFKSSLMGIKNAFISFVIGLISLIPYLFVWGLILGGMAILIKKILKKRKQKGEKQEENQQDHQEKNTQ